MWDSESFIGPERLGIYMRVAFSTNQSNLVYTPASSKFFPGFVYDQLYHRHEVEVLAIA